MWESLQLLSFSPPGWGKTLLEGLANTVLIALGAFAFGLTIGFFGALGKIHGSAPTKWILEIYTTLIRAVPELVLILLLFYAGQGALNAMLINIGYGQVDINPLAAGVLVLGFVQGAYSTEVIRAAMQAVPKGQIEAGYAYGMSRGMMLRRIMIPAIIPLALPGLANLWLIVTKDTALLAVIGSTELATKTRAAAGSTREYLTFYLAAAALYLLLTLVSNRLFSWLERRYRRGPLAA